MKLMARVGTYAMVGFLTASATFGAEARKVTISVTHDGEDTVGQRLAFAVRETVRASSGYVLESGPTAVLTVSLTTLDPDRHKELEGTWTVAAVVITMQNHNTFRPNDPQTWYPIFLTSLVITSGSQRVDDTAKNILASVDAALEQFREDRRKS